jgi:hypothetical protein
LACFLGRSALNCQFAAAIRKVVLFFVVGEYWWMLFAPFATIYFLRHSPVLGAVETFAGLTFGLVSLRAHPGSTAQRQFWQGHAAGAAQCFAGSICCVASWLFASVRSTQTIQPAPAPITKPAAPCRTWQLSPHPISDGHGPGHSLPVPPDTWGRPDAVPSFQIRPTLHPLSSAPASSNSPAWRPWPTARSCGAASWGW